MPVAIVDRVEGKIAVVEVTAFDLGTMQFVGDAQLVEVKKGSFRAGQVWAHDGRRWRRSVPLERMILAGAAGQLEALKAGAPAGDFTVGNPVINVHPPIQQQGPVFPDDFMRDVNTHSWAEVAKRWKISEQSAKDKMNALAAQGFDRAKYGKSRF